MRFQVTADRPASKHIGNSRNRGKQNRQPLPPERPTVDDAGVAEIGDLRDR